MTKVLQFASDSRMEEEELPESEDDEIRRQLETQRQLDEAEKRQRESERKAAPSVPRKPDSRILIH